MANKQNTVAIRELRIFGCVGGLFLMLIGGMMLWRGMAVASNLRIFTGEFLGICGGVFLLFGLLTPKTLTPVYRRWLPAAEKFGAFNTQVLLFLVFWLVLGPVALLHRLFGSDDLRLKSVPRESYFVPKKQVPVTLDTCRHQF